VIRTAAQRVLLRDHTRRVAPALLDGIGQPDPRSGPTRQVDVLVEIERGRGPFPSPEHHPVTRGVSVSVDGRVLVRTAGSSGFCQLWDARMATLHLGVRWAPSPTEELAARLLASRFRALRSQVLLHYPALWWASVHGLSPLHVSAIDLGGALVVLAGPGGLGKSSLVARVLAEGARAVTDNLAVSDGHVVHGVREGLRLPAEVAGPGGSRAAHGRRELPWTPEVDIARRVDLVAVVTRGEHQAPRLLDCPPERAARALTAGTLAAGELRRFWPLAATLALATGRGPVLPDVEGTASSLAQRHPCVELRLGPPPAPSLHQLLAPVVDMIRPRPTSGGRP